MKHEEALAVLGLEVAAQVRARLGPPPPLTDQQIVTLVGIFDRSRRDDVPTTRRGADGAAAEVAS